MTKPNLVAYNCNTSTWEAEIGDSPEFEANVGYRITKCV